MKDGCIFPRLKCNKPKRLLFLSTSSSWPSCHVYTFKSWAVRIVLSHAPFWSSALQFYLILRRLLLCPLGIMTPWYNRMRSLSRWLWRSSLPWCHFWNLPSVGIAVCDPSKSLPSHPCSVPGSLPACLSAHSWGSSLSLARLLEPELCGFFLDDSPPFSNLFPPQTPRLG